MSEVSNNDVKDIKQQSVENYKNIKPEKEMTLSELNDAVKEEFNKASAEARETAVPKEYDDNGVKYREGDSLLPNVKFEVNGYTYETDEKGRTISAEGQLKMADSEYERRMEDVKKIEGQEYRDEDDRGHLIAHQFGGSDRFENLVPMDAGLNRGDYKKLEMYLADAVEEGANVTMKVEPVYESNSTRPSEFRVTYSIDGDKEVTVFKNESEAES